MGSQQTKQAKQIQAEPIKEPQIQLKNMGPVEQTFAKQIQNQNEKNMNHRKSINMISQQVTDIKQSQQTMPARLSKKQPSKKQLPPLKLKNSTPVRNTPLGNCQNVTLQTTNAFEDLQEITCEKNDKSSKDVVLVRAEGKQSEGQKQNNENGQNGVRPKKFRPSQSSSKKPQLTQGGSINQLTTAQQMPQVSAL